MNLPIIPIVPATPLPPQVRETPDTTHADLEVARDAWKAAQEAIMLAWKLTPSPLLRTRTSIPRDQFNQGIANLAAVAMMQECNASLNDIKIDRYARENGQEWAAPTDAEAVARRRDS